MRIQTAGGPNIPLKKEFILRSALFIERALLERYRSGQLSGPKKSRQDPAPFPLEALESSLLVIAFVSESRIKKLNHRFRGKNQVTDVLSFFPVEEDGLGELALCAEQIKKQAESHGLTFEEESFYLILHGILHLLGYNHEKGGRRAKEMYQIQDTIFQAWRAVRQAVKKNRSETAE